MNELKHEDVMRALECCVIQCAECTKCPMYYRKDNRGSCYSDLKRLALALLREKDVEIKGLVDGWSKDQDRFEKVCTEKDAEIERLKAENEEQDEAIKRALHHMGKIRSTERAEAITEFAEGLKQCTECMGEHTVNNPLAETYSVVREEYIDQIAEKLKGESNDSVSESKD